MPDYSNCSLRELHDVAARINQSKYGDRYALVLREIERRESLGAAETPPARNSPSIPKKFIEAIYVVGGAILGFLVGIILLSMMSIDMNPDSPDGIIEMMAAIVVGALAGKVGARMQKAD